MIPKLYTTAEVAGLARRHPTTIRKALESGELHGEQRVPGGRWLVAEECLAEFVRGEQCHHQRSAVVTLVGSEGRRPKPPRPAR